MHPAAIGPFQIQRELGRGGMGEVYLAHDTRLDRQVAIKALPAHLSQDPDRLARFQREAKVLASLNHPGIGAIYGLEQEGGHQYLILEYIEGETLADRLSRGPIPIDDALAIARQIAEALEVAHEKGVIHRDLKPGNVMVTDGGALKVLDFGLARAADGPPSSSVSAAAAPDVTSPMVVHSPTIPGAIMGTAGYMSPEQARGKAVDKRSDVFSFGCVLYEMLTGAMPFRGETVADAIGATLHKELDLSLLPPGTPTPLTLLLRRCLAKDKQHRLRDIGDARVELEQIIANPALMGPASTGRRQAAPWWRSPGAIAAVTLLVASVVVIALLVSSRFNTGVPQAVQPVTRAALALPKGASLHQMDRSLAVSPDGTQVVIAAYPAEDSTSPVLYLRPFSRLDFRALPGTEGATYPVWSPDGRSIAFFADTKLKRVDLAEGIVRVICDAPAGRGCTWGTKGTIVFAPSATGGLFMLNDSGGTPVRVTTPKEVSMGHRVPQMLPDGESFLFFSQSERELYVAGPALKEPKQLMPLDAEAMYVEPGYLVFVRDENLLVQPFDARRLELSGSPQPIAGNVRFDYNRAFMNLGISAGGQLVYQSVMRAPKSRLSWLDKSGQRTPINVEPLPVNSARLSPDARRALAEIPCDHGESTVAVLDLERGTRTQIGDPKKWTSGPVWSPKADSVLCVIDRDGGLAIVSLPATGGGQPRFIAGKPGHEFSPGSVTPDGKTLIFDQRNNLDKISQIMTIDLQTAGAAAAPYMTSPMSESLPRISPAVDAVAFVATSSESGGKVYTLNVAAYPSPGSPVQVSLSRLDVESQWGWLGPHELYWVDANHRAWSASITVKDGQADASPPKPLLGELPIDRNTAILDYDAAHQRFLIATLDGTPDPTELVVVTDWRPESIRTGTRPK